MFVICHTNIMVTLCQITVVNNKSFFWYPVSQFVKNSKFKRNDFRTDIVHYVVHGSYLLHWNVNMHFSNTCNLSIPFFFSLLCFTQLRNLTVFWVRSQTKKHLEHFSILYTLSTEHKDYMMAAIISNLWALNKSFVILHPIAHLVYL
jgi:hypothetical protein